MRKLSNYHKALIIDALKTCGQDQRNSAYEYISESLSVVDSKEIKEFLEWSYNTNRSIGHSNIDSRFSEFKSGSYKVSGDILTLKFNMLYNGRVDDVNHYEYRVESTDIEHVCRMMFGNSRDNKYQDIRIENQLGEVKANFTEEEVFTELDNMLERASEF